MSTPVPSPDDDVIAAGLRDAVASAMGPEATREALGLSWEELAVGLWSEKSTLSARLAVVTRERDELHSAIDEFIGQGEPIGDGHLGGICIYCSAYRQHIRPAENEEHRPDCPWSLLRGALDGDGDTDD